MDPGKRERILKAAIRIFARDGYYNTKVESIAKLAGVATGTIYLYFENKDDIIISIFEEEMVPIIDSMKKDLETKETAVEKINGFIMHHFKMVREHPDMAYLLEVELRQSSKFLHNYHGTKFKEYLDLIADAFELGQRRGEFRDDIQPTIFKQVLFGALDQISMNWTISESRHIILQEFADQVATVVLQGIGKE